MCGMTDFRRTKLILSISAINTVKAEKRVRQYPKICPLPRVFGVKSK